MESLRIYFERLIKLNDAEWLDFQACLSKEVIRKKIISSGKMTNVIISLLFRKEFLDFTHCGMVKRK